MPPKKVAITPSVKPSTNEKQKGIRVDPAKYTMLSNRHLKAKDWAGLGALSLLIYWWLCDKVTSAYDENGVSIGVVMFARPINFKLIANADNLGTTWLSVQRNMKHLVGRGFIRRQRHSTTQGYSYEVIGCAREVSDVIKGRDGKKYKENPPSLNGDFCSAPSDQVFNPEEEELYDLSRPGLLSRLDLPQQVLDAYAEERELA
jgi:hypothetical protein